VKLSQMMTRNVETATPDDTLQSVAQRMKNRNFGPLPVMEGDRIIGMVTDRDITIRATAEGLDPKTTKVRQVMTEEVICAYEDQELEEAAEIMEREQVRRLPILDRNDRLVGIIATADIAMHSEDQEVEAGVLEGVSRP